MNDLDALIRTSLLFDFYGPLLTDHQRKIYEEVVLNDYSISEVAEDEGISRQGVHDMIKRCDQILEGYENKLGMAEKYKKIEALVNQLDDKNLAQQILNIL